VSGAVAASALKRLVEGAGFEPAYALAGRFTVCTHPLRLLANVQLFLVSSAHGALGRVGRSWTVRIMYFWPWKPRRPQVKHLRGLFEAVVGKEKK